MPSTLACDQFFAISELVELFLFHAEPLILVNCQRVCRRWRQIVDRSNKLQENLFMRPLPSTPKGFSPKINPILESHFAPVFQWLDKDSATFTSFELSGIPLQARRCTYDDIVLLPWARDGTAVDARSRRAFARKEASWRDMLISQPPIAYIDWWHTWECTEQRKTPAGQRPLISGDAHEHFQGFLTIGLLWDWIEARLLRECSVQITVFLERCATKDDPTASRMERGWEVQNPLTASRGFSASHARMRIQSHQVWPGAAPSMYQQYDVPERAWRIRDDVPLQPCTENDKRKYSAYNQNGTAWLQLDIQRDSDPDQAAETWRWSKSDAFEGGKLRNVSGHGPGGDRREAVRRRREVAQALTESRGE